MSRNGECYRLVVYEKNTDQCRTFYILKCTNLHDCTSEVLENVLNHPCLVHCNPTTPIALQAGDLRSVLYTYLYGPVNTSRDRYVSWMRRPTGIQDVTGSILCPATYLS